MSGQYRVAKQSSLQQFNQTAFLYTAAAHFNIIHTQAGTAGPQNIEECHFKKETTKYAIHAHSFQ